MANEQIIVTQYIMFQRDVYYYYYYALYLIVVKDL